MTDPTQGHPEPGPADRRQGREMIKGPDLANHANHDPELIAAHATGDLTGRELETAAAQVTGCAECAGLYADLLTIRAALADVAAPARSRDFRLTADQAAALRPGGWRAWLSTLAGPRFSFAAPLGSALAALGLVGLLVAGPGVSLPTGGTTALAPYQESAPTLNGVEPGSGTRAPAGAQGAGPSTAPSAVPAAGSEAPASPASVGPEAAESSPPGPRASGTTAYSATPMPTSDLAAGGEPTAGPSRQLDANAVPTPAPSPAVLAPVSGDDNGGGSTGQLGTVGSGTTGRASDQTGSGGLLASASVPSPVAIGAAVLLLLGLLLVGARLAARRLV
jgi:hypothetical protein